ncbi:MAG: serine--tRNA ligase, partial [Actinobacteria bacterium]|nr:serine--tRNA ligase [Actinomycetota bacterium]
MIDLRLLRDDAAAVQAAYARRGGVDGLDRVIELDVRYRDVLRRVEDLRAEQNRASKEIGRAAPEHRQAAIEAAKALSDELKALEPELESLQAKLDETAAYLPNIPHESVPEGLSEDDNVVEREVGDKPSFDFQPKDHATLAEGLGIVDFERAAKVSGARFAYLKGAGAILEFALVRFAVDRLQSSGFTPVVTPVLVREPAMYGTGFLPADEHEYYRVERDDLYLIGTSEVALAAMHSDEILDEGSLPLRYSGFSSCFRREAGSYGKETRGLIRVHQFDKVEQFSFAHPERSWDEYEVIRANQEAILQALEIPYRVLVMCAGDLGASAAKKVDHEAWLPSDERFMEVTSATNATDYQARRLQIRARTGSDKAYLVHTLNGTACAVGRMIVALLETHQRGDGSVSIPEALRPFTGFDELR